jgi:hypothetical protein
MKKIYGEEYLKSGDEIYWCTDCEEGFSKDRAKKR